MITLTTKLGSVYGKPCGTSDDGKTVYEIHSIPYARAKRFEKPERITQYPKGGIINREETVCFPQHGYPLWMNVFMKHHMMRPEFLPTKDAQTEDAFVVNIWTDDLKGNKPVTVFLHGGGEGSGTVPMYKGDNLAKKGVVAVTVTYRIGSFGYMPTFDGNLMNADLAYLDQQAALLWIRDNIQYFGGDPDNITLVGHCGGGLAALYQFLNPTSSQCFHKLMMLCGNLPSLIDRKTAKEMYQSSLQHYKVSSLSELQNLPAKAFLGHSRIGQSDVFDDAFFIDDPNTLLKEERFPNMPVLIGTNADEFSMIELPMYYRFLGITTKEKDLDAALEKKYKEYGKELKDEIWSEAQSGIDLQVKIMELLVFHTSAFQMMEQISRKCPVYGYRLSYVPALYKGLRGAYHGAELVYFFNNFDKMRIPVTEENKRQASIIQNDWISFIKNGEIPNREKYNEHGLITFYDKKIKSIDFPHKEFIQELLKTDLPEQNRHSYIMNMSEPTGKV
ncbi:carboxylesterase family protein [Olsenella sp. Marseille-P4559]|uniref:carboxylesterase family protein n=1 Tax=Olsenella sp. Marseille-P4559 TaxID=2364795 RepID=UPI001030EDC0|nr:carboxylesterase family protein [Olsenella sp. Marseille-P4559]